MKKSNESEKKEAALKAMIESLDRAKVVFEYYNGMLEQSKKRPDLFIYQVNEVYAMNYENGVAKMGSLTEASVLTKNVSDQIEKLGVFTNATGEKIKPIGAIVAESYFSDRKKEMDELIMQLETIIKSMQNKNETQN